MTRTRVALLLSFVLVLAAGFAVGRLSARAQRRGGRDSWLGRELDLTGEQREQMRAIWSEVMGRLHRDRGERRRELAAERDRAVERLLSEEQVNQYQQIMDEYERGLQALREEREAAFREAVARTKQMLTPVQRAKYEEMLERMRSRDERDDGWRGRSHRGERGPDATATSGPAQD